MAGLADTAGYDKINLHRPAFDFILEWDGGRERRMLYEAYTPLYDQTQVARGITFLGHDWSNKRYPDVGREGFGVLRVLSPTGDRVQLELDGEVMDGLRVSFGSKGFSFKIYCGGQILIADGVGRRYFDAGDQLARRARGRLHDEAPAHPGAGGVRPRRALVLQRLRVRRPAVRLSAPPARAMSRAAPALRRSTSRP